MTACCACWPVLAQADSDRSLILLDEIENGMNPEIIEKLVDALVQAPSRSW